MGKKQLEFEVDMEDKAGIKADANLLELVWTNFEAGKGSCFTVR